MGLFFSTETASHIRGKILRSLILTLNLEWISGLKIVTTKNNNKFWLNVLCIDQHFLRRINVFSLCMEILEIGLKHAKCSKQVLKVDSAMLVSISSVVGIQMDNLSHWVFAKNTKFYQWWITYHKTIRSNSLSSGAGAWERPVF